MTGVDRDVSVVEVKDTIRNLGFYLKNNTPLDINVHLDSRSKPFLVYIEKVVGRWAACNLYFSIGHLRTMYTTRTLQKLFLGCRSILDIRPETDTFCLRQLDGDGRMTKKLRTDWIHDRRFDTLNFRLAETILS